ncbi:copper chaperone PCu(A)C [Streptomyces sp. OE57]|uniref:copper chaperone PCu(A)C n=1 Tax=Streptomyces lacaronensis TaxID=3379885 RepID=UPI0039B74455
MTNASWTLPSPRRIRDSLLAVVAPVCACVLALGGLAAWTAKGNAGSPPRIGVTEARLFLPSPDLPKTAAFFRITNTGGARDRLVGVTSSVVTGEISLSRHRMTGRGAAYRQATESLPVPAGGALDMSPETSDVTVPVTAHWRRGDVVPFTLRFEHSGRIEVEAVVVRPGEG